MRGGKRRKKAKEETSKKAEKTGVKKQ